MWHWLVVFGKLNLHEDKLNVSLWNCEESKNQPLRLQIFRGGRVSRLVLVAVNFIFWQKRTSVNLAYIFCNFWVKSKKSSQQKYTNSGKWMYTYTNLIMNRLKIIYIQNNAVWLLKDLIFSTFWSNLQLKDFNYLSLGGVFTSFFFYHNTSLLSDRNIFSSSFSFFGETNCCNLLAKLLNLAETILEIS